MSGSRGFSSAVTGVGRNALDVPVAVLAALAVAFLAFAIPPDQLSHMVGVTGLPELLPAAEPPLGNKARIGIGVGGAVAIFALVFGLLRLLDRKSRVREAEESVDAPRLRRRDLHPDAPARRPISATSEFGEPEPVATAVEATPAWLAPAELPEQEWAPAEPEVVESLGANDLDCGSGLAEPVLDVPERAGVPSEPCIVDTELMPSSGEKPRAQSIAELMVRLEQGLARRQPGGEPAAPAPAALPDDTEPSPVAGNDRLQSAIDSLQRLASRQG